MYPPATLGANRLRGYLRCLLPGPFFQPPISTIFNYFRPKSDPRPESKRPRRELQNAYLEIENHRFSAQIRLESGFGPDSGSEKSFLGTYVNREISKFGAGPCRRNRLRSNMCRKTNFFMKNQGLARPRGTCAILRYPALFCAILRYSALLRTIRVLFFGIRPHFVRQRALFDPIRGKQ